MRKSYREGSIPSPATKADAGLYVKQGLSIGYYFSLRCSRPPQVF